MLVLVRGPLPVERVTRIELALSAWEADVLPLNYTREQLLGGDYAAPRAHMGQRERAG